MQTILIKILYSTFGNIGSNSAGYYSEAGIHEHLGADHLTFEGGRGRGGVEDLRKKNPAQPLQ